MFTSRFIEEYDHYKIDLDNPNSNLREDLQQIRFAESLGWTIIEGATFADPLQFRLDSLRIWSYKEGWVCGEWIRQNWCNQCLYKDLRQALELEAWGAGQITSDYIGVDSYKHTAKGDRVFLATLESSNLCLVNNN